MTFVMFNFSIRAIELLKPLVLIDVIEMIKISDNKKPENTFPICLISTIEEVMSYNLSLLKLSLGFSVIYKILFCLVSFF